MREGLPEGWVETIIGDISEDISYGFTAKAMPSPVGPKLLRITDIQKDSVNWESVPFCKISKDIKAKYTLRIGDIVFARTGATTGKSYLIKLCPESIFASYLIRVRPSKDVLPKFISFYFQSASYWEQIFENISGSAQPNCNASKLSMLSISIAPLSEQRRIVAKLDILLGKVDACRKRLAKVPVLLKRFRQSVLAAACLGRLTEDWRENTNSEDDLPSSWEKLNLSEICELITKGASPKWQGINYSTRGILFITSENVGSGKMLLNNKKYVEAKINEIQPRSILKKGDLLTNIVGASIGRSALFNLEESANINQAVALIRLKSNIDRKYILFVLNSPNVIDHMNYEKVDVARANLSLRDVSEFPIPLPPFSEQQEIVRRVEELFALADRVEERYRKAMVRLDKMTQSILAKAFRGELVQQDPNDEPASVLLERIRAERANEKVASRQRKTRKIQQTGKHRVRPVR